MNNKNLAKNIEEFDNDTSSENKSASKFKLVDSKGRRTTSKYFYSIANHHELFKLGSSFYNDYQQGVKSFAISSTGYQTSQQNSILGIASYFDRQESDVNIAIISDNLFDGVFKGIVEASDEEDLKLDSINMKTKVFRFHEHFDFLDLEDLIKFKDDHGEMCYEDALDSIIAEYDVIFWDVPEIYKIQEKSEIYFPVISRYDSLSIIVNTKGTCHKDIEEIRSFFFSYGINLKGLLFDSQKVAKTAKKKKSWWGFF